MAKKGNEVINLGKEDFERKSFKTAPGGTYYAKIGAKSALKEMKGGTGINVAGTITKGPHKGVNFFDNIGPNVKWKIAQIVAGLKMKKTKFTIAELLKLIKGGELRVILRERTFEGKKRNEVVQYLPLIATKDEPTADVDDDEDDEDEELDDDGDTSEAEEEEDDEDEDTDDDSEDDEEDDTEDDDDSDDEEEDDDEEETDEDDEDEEDEGDDEEEEADDEEDEDDDEVEEDDEEDEEEEEPAPPPRRAKKKVAPAKKAAPPAKKSGRRK